MRSFQITNSEKFTGEAELIYNSKDLLIVVDCSNANMDAETMALFKRAAPVHLKDIQAAFTAPTIIVESNMEVTFEMFYKAYPLKRNRFKAEKLWPKLSKADQVEAYYSLADYKKYLKKNDWQSPMIADSFLIRKEYKTEWKKLK